MQTYDTETQEGTEPDRSTPDERPEECVCWDAEARLACWACYRVGFEIPNPEEPGAEDED